VGWSNYDVEDNYVAANIIKELLPQVKVKVAFANDSLKTAALNLLDSMGVENSMIESHVYSGANVWMRDYGAVFAIDSTRQLAMLDFGWNQYGQPDWRRKHWPQYFEGKYDSIKSAAENSATSRVDSLMGITTSAKYNQINMFLEGGSFEYNGNGVLIQTEAVTLQRNPGRTKTELEAEFKCFGVEKVIWLPQGVIEDEHFQKLVDNKYMVGGTGGHTDEYVRFVNENTILLAWVEKDEIDEHPLNKYNFERMSVNFEILQNATDINGKPFNIIKAPMPRPIETPLTIVEKWSPDNWENRKMELESIEKGHQLVVGDTIHAVAASGYLNFLITNGLVITATYSQYGSADRDEVIKEILQKAFPNRKVVMIDALALNGIFGGGGIHCVTMHEPKVE
jgi:agmatine deiminase